MDIRKGESRSARKARDDKSRSAIDLKGLQLVCPRCRAPLDDLTRCDTCDLEFLTVGDRPVLMDFATSIIRQEWVLETGAESRVSRRDSKIYQAIRRIVFGSPRVSRRNASRFLSEIKRRFAAPKVLIVGGATMGSGTEPLYDDPGVSVFSFDIYASRHIDFIADAHQIPLREESFDGVWIQAVLEHVLSPEQVVAEIRRVLKPSGLVYAETPFMQHVHEGAFDFTRFTHSGHRWLFRDFEELDSGEVAGAGTQLLWSVDHFVRALTRSHTAGKAAKLALFWLRWFDRIVDEEHSLDAASCCYLLASKGSTAIEPSSVQTYYRGAQ